MNPQNNTSLSDAVTALRLWEVKHPYYCSEGNYHALGWLVQYESWVDFISSEDGLDLDLNLLFRWDWKPPIDDDEQITWKGGEDDRESTLDLFFMLQRKAANRSVHVAVARSEEPVIREWLERRFNHTMRLWEPLQPAATR